MIATLTIAQLQGITITALVVAVSTGICGAWACWRLSRQIKRTEGKK